MHLWVLSQIKFKKKIIFPHAAFFWGILSREGVIINCPQKDLFHDPRDIIITSWMAFCDLVNNDSVFLLAIPLEKWTPLVVVRKDFSDMVRTISACLDCFIYIWRKFIMFIYKMI